MYSTGKYKMMKTQQAECNKPLRLIELACDFICVCLLMIIPNYDDQNETCIPPESLIYFYSAFGSIFLITALDMVCQVFREPILTTPMIIFSFVASVLCLAAVLLSFFQYNFMSDYIRTRHLFMIVVLGSVSLFGSCVYAIDGIILLRRSKFPSKSM
ncbi:UNVERIFIED_CONTAM: hypothetical protein PYX00_000485 [Menopon gallinae]|uniref:MARVEL domain-containing protein n=1 Tax=Menopon gallinae TaxID=328185 RepID=A0AAW2IAL7_9NEOP